MITISQEAKDALIEALKVKLAEYVDKEDYSRCDGLEAGMRIIESFPVSDCCNQSACATWITVTERLPERMQEVFAFSSKTGIRGIAFQVDGSWYFDDGNDTIFSDVTHWQPLPSPPVTK